MNTNAAHVATFAATIAPAARESFLARAAVIAEVAKARKTLTDDELNAALQVSSHVSEPYDFVRTLGLPCSAHENGKFQWRPDADKARDALEMECRAQVCSEAEELAVRSDREAIMNTLKGRAAKATREANAADRAADAEACKNFTAGQSVQVHAFGHWYPGTVVKLNRAGRAVVSYTTGTGVTREKTVQACHVRG